METYNDLTGKTYGDVPLVDVQQMYSDTCAIKSQQLIMKEFGINATEDQLVQCAMENGWYNNDGNGTIMEDVGKLLAYVKIPTTQMLDANIYDLANQLAQGHKVIVGVDSGELWNDATSGWFNDMWHGNTPDHALIVAGLDLTDPNNPTVILTDPGTGEAAAPYPLDQFMDAWKDSSNFMVSTDIPAQGMTQAFQNLGYDEYHLPSIADVDYSDFTMFHNYSHILQTFDCLDMMDPYGSLYDAFNTMPTMCDWSFYDALDYAGLPYYNMGLFDGNTFYNPLPIIPTCSDFDNSLCQDLINSLQRNYDDCMQYADHAMDSGFTATAQIFVNQANSIQESLNDITPHIQV